MPVRLLTLRHKRQRYPRRLARLHLEPLELRSLPSVTSWPGLLNPAPETEPNDTLALAGKLGDLSITGRAEAVGTIGQGLAGASDVDWYTFKLTQPAAVTLATLDRQGGSPLVSVLSLYNNDVFDFADPYDRIGHRLVAQDDGAAHGGDATIVRELSPGTYYVAVSGSGDNYFHPFLAGSGYPGSTGDYGLLLTATNLPSGFNIGPTVLAADPAGNAILNRSPLIVRLDFSEPIDPTQIVLGWNVRLIYNAKGTFGDGHDNDIQLTGSNFSPDLTQGPSQSTANELQLTLPSALIPGYYKVFLAGDATKNVPVLTDLNGVALGTDPTHLSGSDYTMTFQVNGIDGNTAVGAQSDDTPATAHQLGDVTNAGLVQVTGSIGSDPAYDPASLNPYLANPAAQVDLYHFRITGPGRFSFGAEVFAGRIGSSLDPGLTLFRLDPTDQTLHLVDVNDNTGNPSRASNRTVPLFTDAALFDGLTQGDYYLAVSGTGNLPNPALGRLPGTNGVFDPSKTHSGTRGFTTGSYVLNLLVQDNGQPPQVVSTNPAPGTTLAAPPVRLTVQFSDLVNVQQLAYVAAQQNGLATLNAVYVLGADGKKYYPRVDSYDAITNQATFLMLDALPNGVNVLHLSGSLGLTDLSGNALVGNDPSGDYVVSFTVNGPARGTNGNPLVWTDQEPNNDLSHAQLLGVLFPNELAAGVNLVRNAGSASSDTDDYYQFEVLQSRTYSFNLTGSSLPAGVQTTLTDATGNQIPLLYVGDGSLGLVTLDPGTYVVDVGGWKAAQAANVAYQLQIKINSGGENPTPLTVGPAPVLHIRLARNDPPPTGNPPTSLPPSVPTVAAAPSASPVQLSTLAADSIAPSIALSSTAFPPELLAGLITGTVGGVRGPAMVVPPAFTDRFLAGSSEPVLMEGIVRTVILTQMPQSGTGSALPTETNQPIQVGRTLASWVTLTRQGVDALMEAGERAWQDFGNWLRNLAVPLETLDSWQGAPVIDIPAAPEEGPEAAAPHLGPVDRAGVFVPRETGVATLLVAAALATVSSQPTREEERGSSDAPRVRKGSR
jgi:hypothetical protein